MGWRTVPLPTIGLVQLTGRLLEFPAQQSGNNRAATVNACDDFLQLIAPGRVKHKSSDLLRQA
jgi:hypothetical protein